uniref:Uncharacterized protein n=1 Tax=Setaria italica TaxID=4555 RepID=K3YFI8_SETIT
MELEEDFDCSRGIAMSNLMPLWPSMSSMRQLSMQSCGHSYALNSKAACCPSLSATCRRHRQSNPSTGVGPPAVERGERWTRP